MSEKKVLLPELGEGVTEGELVKWLVAKGDSVESDTPSGRSTDRQSLYGCPLSSGWQNQILTGKTRRKYFGGKSPAHFGIR